MADPEAVECLDELLLSPQVNPVLLRILASCARDIKRCADVLDGMDRNSVSVVDGGFSPQEVEVLVKELGEELSFPGASRPTAMFHSSLHRRCYQDISIHSS